MAIIPKRLIQMFHCGMEECGSAASEEHINQYAYIVYIARPPIHLLHSINQYCYEEEGSVCCEGEGYQI